MPACSPQLHVSDHLTNPCKWAPCLHGSFRHGKCWYTPSLMLGQAQPRAGAGPTSRYVSFLVVILIVVPGLTFGIHLNWLLKQSYGWRPTSCHPSRPHCLTQCWHTTPNNSCRQAVAIHSNSLCQLIATSRFAVMFFLSFQPPACNFVWKIYIE